MAPVLFSRPVRPDDANPPSPGWHGFEVATSGMFGDVLRRHRRAAALTQDELADRAGLSPKAISAIERGMRRRPA
jgi:ribosome-binding protein aMBF1 (putative translation factor)